MLKRFLIIGALLVSAIGFTGASPALAAGETCNGKAATITVMNSYSAATSTAYYYGTSGADVIWVANSGSYANVTVYGYGGNDTICGEGGQNNNKRFTVFAGNGNDWMSTGKKGDSIYPGWGNDYVSAWGGNDYIQPSNSYDVIDCSWGYDTLDYFYTTAGSYLFGCERQTDIHVY